MRRVPLALALTLLLPALGQAALTVSPARIEKAVSPDDNTLDFVISNPSKVAVEVTLSTAPITHDRQGASREAKPGGAYDASGLIHFDKATHFTLAARRWRRIHAHVDVPSRPGGGYAFIYVQGVDANQSAHQVVNVLRVGAVVELTFPDPGKKAVAVEGLVTRDGELRVVVRNEGQIHVAPQGTVTLQDQTGKELTATLETANIFPGLVRELKVTGLPPTLPSGSYAAKVAIRAPTDATLSEVVAVKDGEITRNSGLAVIGAR
jgi:hypothetical protein